MGRKDPFFWCAIACGFIVVAYITLPLADRQIREGVTVSVFLDAGAIHSFA